MGCSNNSLKEIAFIKKPFIQYKNIKTIEKLEPELTEDFGVVFFMELTKNKFLISIQNGKVAIYDKINEKPLSIIDLKDHSANQIVKMKNGNYLFGCDFGKLFFYSINEENNTYKEINSFKLKYNITKMIETDKEIILSDYKTIYFLDNSLNNDRLSVNRTFVNHLPQLDIFNIFLIDNLLLSFAYAQIDDTPNEFIIQNIEDGKVVFKDSDASVMPWNQTVYKFNSNILAITGNSCEIHLFDIKSFKVLAFIKDLDFFYSVICFGNQIFCGSDKGEIYEFDYDSEKNELKFISKTKIQEASIFGINLTSDGEIVTTSRDGTVKFFK